MGARSRTVGGAVDTRADLYSAGASLFFALTGRPPFDAENYNKLRQRGRGEIELDWELHEDATVRTESAFADDDDAPRLLEALQSERSVEIDLDAFDLAAKPIPIPEPVRRGPGPWPFVIFGVMVVIAVILALAMR